MFYFPTCFLLRFLSSSGLFTHVLFRHGLWSLRHVVFSDMFSSSPRLFYWPVYACHVPACFMVAPACFIFRHVFCFASFVLLAGLFAHVLFRHFLWSLRHVVFTDMFSACVSSGMFLLSTCFGMFDFLACLSTFFFRLVSFPFTFAARYVSSSLWSLRQAGPPACLPTFVVATLYVPACFFCRILSACLLFWHVYVLSSFGLLHSTHNCGQVLVLLVVATTGRAQLRLSNAVQRRHDMTMASSFLHADCVIMSFCFGRFGSTRSCGQQL